jgi:hypothetical protein
MAFQNSLFWLVDKRSVKTHIRTVVRIFRIWTGVPDVVYLAGNFCFANRKKFCYLNFQLCFTDKNFKQPNCFWLSMHAYRHRPIASDLYLIYKLSPSARVCISDTDRLLMFYLVHKIIYVYLRLIKRLEFENWYRPKRLVHCKILFLHENLWCIAVSRKWRPKIKNGCIACIHLQYYIVFLCMQFALTKCELN